MNQTLSPLLFTISFIVFCWFYLSPGAYAKTAAITRDTVVVTKKQELNAAYNLVYRENLPTIFFGNEYGAPERLMLAADINPNIVILNSSNSRFFVLLSPRVQARLFSGYHSPVKSPSYMPGATVFSRVNNDPSHPKFLSLGYSHHSNGQEGPTLDSAGNFFRDGGKFTTNFYTLNYYFSKRQVTEQLARIQSAFIGIEVHSGLFGKGYSKQLSGKYGFLRTNGSWYYDLMSDHNRKSDHYGSHQRLRFDFTYILDKIYNYQFTDVTKRLNVSLKYYYQFGFMENMALMIGAGYRGQDPYNIYFQNNYPFVAIGVASGLSFDLRKKKHDGAM